MQWWLSCCGATNSTKLAQRQIMMCGATKLRRPREWVKFFASGVNTVTVAGLYWKTEPSGKNSIVT